MKQVVRIKLASTDLERLEGLCKEIRDIATRAGAKVRGPTPLPTTKLVLPVRKSPCGEGTKTWRRWEMRVHKRLMDLTITDPRVMREIMRIQVPETIAIEMRVKS